VNTQDQTAEATLCEHLTMHPDDVTALHRLARLYVAQGRRDEAEPLFVRALSIAPEFVAARRDYVALLDHQMKWNELNAQLDILLRREPHNRPYTMLKASALAMLGEYADAIARYEQLLAEGPADILLWTRYGHALRAVGRHDDCVAAYRRSVAQNPGFGAGWRNLANLKTFRFTPEEIELMREQLERQDLAAQDRSRVHFALGKAFEDAGDPVKAFEHYRQGAALRQADHDSGWLSTYVDRCKATLTKEFFKARMGWGCSSLAPIFIVGMPRSGSTLIEQILSAHSLIEGTTELPDLIHLVSRIEHGGDYPDVLRDTDAAELRTLGEAYLRRTHAQRKLGRPFFIDKMPDNFQHVGLIRLILPNAKIIDARRHPLGCGVSLFRQDFARGMEFTYDLAHIGRYYRDYVELMFHFDTVIPGYVYRVFYEDMVLHPEREIRRLLDYCGVAFEEPCLDFHSSARSVSTSSSEQVRRPIYTDALDQWRLFEPWLDPLKTALGAVLDCYPLVPDFEADPSGSGAK
jgi:tetratricopeptide (TPR) repeat protein